MNTNVNVKVVDTLNTSGKVESTNELTTNATVESGEVETEATVETSKTLTANLNVTIPTTLKASVEISQGTNALTKSDHAGLKNLDFESSGHTGFASKNELQEYAKKTEQTLDETTQEIEESLETIRGNIKKKQDKCINNNVLYVGDDALIGLNNGAVKVGNSDRNLVFKTLGDRPQWTDDGETLKDLAITDDIEGLQNQIDGVSDDITHLQNKLDNVSSDSKLELKSQIQRIGEYRYLIIQIPYSDSLLNEINSGKVNLQLYKQSKKKATQMRNAFVKWTCPTGNIGFGSEHFKKSFGEGMFTVASGGISIPPFITIGENTSSILEMTYTTNIIQLTYNLSELAKAMCFLMNDDSTVTSAEWDGSMGENKYTDTVVNCSNVIGKRFRNNRVALRYKMRLYFETTQKYSEYTDTITILYTKHLDTNYVKIGMQIN